MKIWVVIPARAGSKRLKNKNLLIFKGKSLVANTLTEVSKIKAFEIQIILSTDSNSVIAESSFFSNCVIHKRKLSISDQATANDVIKEFIADFLNEIDVSIDWILYCQPTSPFIRTNHFEQIIKMGLENNKNVVTILNSPVYLEKLVFVNKDGILNFDAKNFDPVKNSQDVKNIAFMPNGAGYFFRIRDFIAGSTFPIAGSIAFPMSSIDSIDINNEEDLQLANSITL